jgi:membrane protease YdiL (CAAX protease family)
MTKKAKTRSKGIRDLLIFFVFAGVPIVSFWLQGYPDTPFYASMLVVFLVLLIWLRQYHEEHEYSRLLDYDENLNAQSFLWILLGIVGVYLTASVVVSQFVKSVIWVPMHGLEVTYIGFQLSGIWNDILFQLVLVASAEELCKLDLHMAFYMRLKGLLSDGLARALSIGIPIFFWSMLHVYRAYTGPLMFQLLAAAFAGGLIIFAVMYTTRSLLAAILTHAGYNCLIIYLTQVLAAAT